MTEENVIHTDANQLREGLDLETDLHHRLVVEVPTLTVEFQLDPNDVRNSDDVFTLFSTDEAETYRCAYTVRNDHVQGDQFLTLVWRWLDTSLNYTLRIDPGIGEDAYDLFADVPYNTLKQAEESSETLDDWDGSTGSDEEASQEVPQDVETKLEDEDPTDEETDSAWDELLDEEEDDGEPEPEEQP